VSPSAHYQMGGVRIGVDCRTNLEGLFVAGEDAGGVHGANRLGGNGVADSIVFGGCAGDAMADYVHGRSQTKRFIEPSNWRYPRETGESPFALRKELEDLMWERAGVVRNAAGLESALESLNALDERAAKSRMDSLPAMNATLDLVNLIEVAKLVAQSALLRTESRGAHYREDFPQSDPAWLKNIVLTPGEEPRYEPVQFTRLVPT
jgi:succinate dehydrogenase/fumarate reductase flavoprotein subunit